MRYIYSAILMTAVLSFFVLSSNAEHVIDDSKNPSYQFIISGDTGALKDGKLSLTGVPIVTFYKLGDKRLAGHIFVESFVEVWDKNAKILKTDPPNGIISVISKEGSEGATIELSAPSADIDDLSFNVRVLEGALPDSFGPFQIYIRLTLDEDLKTQE